MSVKDIASDIRVRESIKRAAHVATATGTAVDLQGFNGGALVFLVTTLTNGTHTPKLQHNDTSTTGDSGWANVNSTTEQAGSLAALAANTNQKVSYYGSKRFIRAKVTLAGSTGGCTYSSVVVAGAPSQAPASA